MCVFEAKVIIDNELRTVKSVANNKFAAISNIKISFDVEEIIDIKEL